MKNKKAVKFLGEHTINLIITVIVLVFLIYLGVKVYGIFTEENELEKAIVQLEKITDAVNNIWNNNGGGKVEVFSPGEKWFLVSFLFDFPEGECRGEKGCLCICRDTECSEPKSRKCNGFNFNVKVRGWPVALGRTSGQRETGERYSIPVKEFEYIELPPIGELVVSKEENKVSVYGENYGQIDKGQEIYY
ncbi:MAG: hypothetical protein AABX77_02860 [Nanoarchaeota archaeon]